MSSGQQIYVLKDFNIYEGIPEKEFCDIARSSVDRKYKKGNRIYSPYEDDGNIYVVHRGEIVLYHSKDGKRAIFDTLGPGSVFGSFDFQNPRPNHFAEVTKNAMLCVTPVKEFLQVISAYPETMLRMMQKLAIRINDYEEKIKSNIETASERIYSELVRLQKKRKSNPITRLIPLQITHEKIAEHTNLNRVTVTRSIKRLKDEGMIEINDKTGVIKLR